jgi:hypothetical protein
MASGVPSKTRPEYRSRGARRPTVANYFDPAAKSPDGSSSCIV